MRIFSVIIPAILLAAGGSGCGRDGEAPHPPHERNRVMIRMFDNISDLRFEEAAHQAAKYGELVPENTYMPQLLTIIQVNRAIVRCSNLLAAGNLEDAADIIENCRRKYPFDERLSQAARELQSLAEIQREIKKFRRAENAGEMTAALFRIEELFKARRDQSMAKRVAELKKQIESRVLYENAIARRDLLLENIGIRTARDASLRETFAAQLRVEHVAP